MKKIQQYGAGQEVPEGSQYLTSVVLQMAIGNPAVIHFFLVDEKKKEVLSKE